MSNLTDSDFKKVIKKILPKNVSLEMLSDDITTSSSQLLNLLSKEEKKILEKTTKDKRIREFCLGRLAAKNAIFNLDINKNSNEIEVLRTLDNRPLWTSGFVGSISHCNKKAVAITARESDYYGLGVDILTNNRVCNPKILETLCSEEERLNLLKNWKYDPNLLNLTVFSVKESLYKLFSSLNFKKMEWYDFNLTEIRNAPNEDHSIAKVKFSEHFYQKTSRKDLYIMPEMEINILETGSYLLSFILYQKRDNTKL